MIDREETIEFQHLPILIEKINEILLGELLCNCIQRSLLVSLFLSTIQALLTCFAVDLHYVIVGGSTSYAHRPANWIFRLSAVACSAYGEAARLL